VLGAVSVEAHGGLKPSPALKRLGDASYSLYLVHTPVIAVFNRIIGPTNPVLFFSLAMILSVAAGLACHRFVERPLLALFRPRANAPAEASAGA
jgi:exopolysaccharide production protein ExoZ